MAIQRPRAKALAELVAALAEGCVGRARLLDRMRQEREQAQAAARRGMVSTGDRSAKIRTYNFPQSRVTDHRIGLTVYNLPGVLEGDLDPLIGPLRLADNEAKLSGEV